MILDEIKAFINAHGYDFEIDGINNRWRTARDKSGLKMWHIGGDDGQGFARFSFGECGDKQKKFSWCSKNGSMTEAEQKSFAKFTAKIAKAKEGQQLVTAEVVQSLMADWGSAETADIFSQYLMDKGFGKRAGPPGTVVRNDSRVKNILCVPMYDEYGFMWGVQQLFGGGKKTFWPGSKVKGTFFRLGADTETILVGEGFATCLAAHLATNYKTYCAWNTGNLEFVVKMLLSAGHQPNNIILLADFDGGTFKKTGKNPGMLCTQKLTRKYKVRFAYPPAAGAKDINWDFADAHKAGITIALSPLTYAHIAGAIYEEERKEAKPTKKAEELMEMQLKLGENAVKITQNATEAPVVLDTMEPVKDAVITTNVVTPNYGSLSVDMLPDVDPLVKKNPRPLATVRNLRTILDHIGATIRYNVIKKDEDWILPGEDTLMDDRKNVLFARILDLCSRVCMPTGQVDKFLRYIAEQNVFNPVQTWIESREWDGVSRLEEFFKTVSAKDEALKKLLMRRWMISAVAAAYRPNGIMAPGLLVFQGAQYIGKTKWFKALVPEDLDLLAEGKTLKPDDKDSVKQVLCYWLVELGEIDATFRRSDLAQLKSFITRGVDMFRAAYARKESQFPRRTVFFGSVNKKEFLLDETGNRRYWTIECDAINWDHKMDMQQVWAEVAALYKGGEQWWLSENEMRLLNASNENFEAVDPVKELLQSFEWGNLEGNWESATEIHRRILPNSTPKQAELNKISHFVKLLNGGKSRKSNGKRELWVPKPSGKGLDRPSDPKTVPF